MTDRPASDVKRSNQIIGQTAESDPILADILDARIGPPEARDLFKDGETTAGDAAGDTQRRYRRWTSTY